MTASPSMTTSDAIAIAAAMMATALTVFAIIVGIAAFWGIAGLRAAAKTAAAEEARKHVMDMLSPESETGKKLLQEVERRMTSIADQLYADISLSTAFPRSGEEESSNIADEYPKE